MVRFDSPTLWALTTGWIFLVVLAVANQEPSHDGSMDAPIKMECRLISLKHGDCEYVAKPARALFEKQGEIHYATWYTPTNAAALGLDPAVEIPPLSAA